MDEVLPVPKGVNGADLLQRVRSPSGQLCGTIVWEAKQTRNWSGAWIPKLKDDQQAVGAELAVLVTSAMPRDPSGKCGDEMKNAFNRDREMQTVYRVKHPERIKEFRPAHEKNRQPRRRPVSLSGLAAYVSAFQVVPGMIDDLEALLVRGFANDLLNARMERFAHARSASKRRRKGKG
jgi:hypothetical protein